MLRLFHKNQTACLIVFLLCTKMLSAQVVPSVDIFPNFIMSMRSPAISPDGSYVIFIAEYKEIQTVMESYFADGKWSTPSPVEMFGSLVVKPKSEVGGFSFNYDGSLLLFHAKIEDSYDIYCSKRKGTQWGEPKRFEEPVNSPLDEFSPNLTVDNNNIFFLRPKQGVKQDPPCKDIFLYSKNNEGKWVGPQYIPSVFNAGCQETPFFCADGKTLFFASQRADTNKFGKKIDDSNYNIYYTRLYSDNIFDNLWFNPVYAEGLSTEYNDLSPCMDYKGENFLMNVYPDRVSKKQGRRIYKMELPSEYAPMKTMVIKGKISDLYTKQPLQAKVVVSDAITSTVYGEYATLDDGSYSIFLKESTSYKLDFFKDGYSHTYYLEETDRFTENIIKKFDVELYENVMLNLNVFDNELFYPLAPVVTVSDSISGEVVIDRVPMQSLGKFKCKLGIGKVYKFTIKCQNFEPYYDSFDLRADVLYSNFERDVELQARKKIFVLDIDQGSADDSAPLSINVRNLTRNETQSVLTKRDKEGNLIVELREGDIYEIDVSKKGYTYYNTKVDVNSSKGTQKLDVKLELLTSETKLSFKNITFEYNSSELNQVSYAELDRLVEFLAFNNNVRIELSAHTDDIGPDLYNMHLSDKRAQSTMKYLIMHGVPEKNLVAKGYGKSAPMVPNDSDANRALNRRVEVKILD